MRIINWLLRRIFNLLCRIDKQKFETFPKTGPIILVGNHINFIEVPLLISHLDNPSITGLAKRETWDNPLFKFLFTCWGIIPIDRGLVDREAGYLRNSALEFFEIEILAQSFRSPLLTQFTLINFENIRTVSAYDTPLSWHLNLAWLDQEVGQARPAGHIRLEGSIGFAADWGQHLTTYTMLGTQGRPGMVGMLAQGR